MSNWNFFKTIIWWIFGGLPVALGYAVSGLVWCVTIIGIPFGIQAFKLALVALFPFGAEISDASDNPLGCIGNIIWIIFFGWEIALTHIIFGILLCITIIGIPWGRMHFHMVGISFAPFGREIAVLTER